MVAVTRPLIEPQILESTQRETRGHGHTKYNDSEHQPKPVLLEMIFYLYLALELMTVARLIFYKKKRESREYGGGRAQSNKQQITNNWRRTSS